MKNYKALEEFVAPVVVSGGGYAYAVPGHQGRRYVVYIRPQERGGKRFLRVWCTQDLGSLGENPCPSEKGRGLCYHKKVALCVHARARGYRVVMFRDEPLQPRVSFGAKWVPVVINGGSVVWMGVRK